MYIGLRSVWEGFIFIISVVLSKLRQVFKNIYFYLEVIKYINMYSVVRVCCTVTYQIAWRSCRPKLSAETVESCDQKIILKLFNSSLPV